MKRLITFAFLLISSFLVSHKVMAQTGASTAGIDSVKAAVNALFDAMKRSDSTAISGSFHPRAIIQSIDESGGQIQVKSHAVNEFARIISAFPAGAADEQATLSTVNVDGNLASVWAPYRFIFRGNFHHCGVDAIQLVRIDGVWKIQYILDTEHKQGCPQ